MEWLDIVGPIVSVLLCALLVFFLPLDTDYIITIDSIDYYCDYYKVSDSFDNIKITLFDGSVKIIPVSVGYTVEHLKFSLYDSLRGLSWR